MYPVQKPFFIEATITKRKRMSCSAGLKMPGLYGASISTACLCETIRRRRLGSPAEAASRFTYLRPSGVSPAGCFRLAATLSRLDAGVAARRLAFSTITTVAQPGSRTAHNDWFFVERQGSPRRVILAQAPPPTQVCPPCCCSDRRAAEAEVLGRQSPGGDMLGGSRRLNTRSGGKHVVSAGSGRAASLVGRALCSVRSRGASVVQVERWPA